MDCVGAEVTLLPCSLSPGPGPPRLCSHSLLRERFSESTVEILWILEWRSPHLFCQGGGDSATAVACCSFAAIGINWLFGCPLLSPLVHIISPEFAKSGIIGWLVVCLSFTLVQNRLALKVSSTLLHKHVIQKSRNKLS